MKFLTDYMEEKQTQLFKETNAFFAFSQSQFNEGKKEGVKYVNMHGGMFCNILHTDKLTKGLEEIWQTAIKQDIEENGIPAIIIRELHNHEAFYTCDIEQTAEELEPYNIHPDIILMFYHEERIRNQNNDNY
jgi:uncharacterized membrane protein YgaE (UPF0421/DUF939 family)